MKLARVCEPDPYGDIGFRSSIIPFSIMNSHQRQYRQQPSTYHYPLLPCNGISTKLQQNASPIQNPIPTLMAHPSFHITKNRPNPPSPTALKHRLTRERPSPHQRPQNHHPHRDPHSPRIQLPRRARNLRASRQNRLMPPAMRVRAKRRATPVCRYVPFLLQSQIQVRRSRRFCDLRFLCRCYWRWRRK